MSDSHPFVVERAPAEGFTRSELRYALVAVAHGVVSVLDRFFGDFDSDLSSKELAELVEDSLMPGQLNGVFVWKGVFYTIHHPEGDCDLGATGDCTPVEKANWEAYIHGEYWHDLEYIAPEPTGPETCEERQRRFATPTRISLEVVQEEMDDEKFEHIVATLRDKFEGSPPEATPLKVNDEDC